MLLTEQSKTEIIQVRQEFLESFVKGMITIYKVEIAIYILKYFFK